MAVDHALGVAGGARGERDQRRSRRVGRDGAGHRLVGEQVVEGLHFPVAPLAWVPTSADDRHVRAQVGLELHAAELLGGDEDPRLGRARMWASSLRP